MFKCQHFLHPLKMPWETRVADWLVKVWLDGESHDIVGKAKQTCGIVLVVRVEHSGGYSPNMVVTFKLVLLWQSIGHGCTPVSWPNHGRDHWWREALSRPQAAVEVDVSEFENKCDEPSPERVHVSPELKLLGSQASSDGDLWETRESCQLFHFMIHDTLLSFGHD